MNEERGDLPTKIEPIEADPQARKRPWITPTLRHIKAGSAEVGTQAANDGAFTTS